MSVLVSVSPSPVSPSPLAIKRMSFSAPVSAAPSGSSTPIASAYSSAAALSCQQQKDHPKSMLMLSPLPLFPSAPAASATSVGPAAAGLSAARTRSKHRTSLSMSNITETLTRHRRSKSREQPAGPAAAAAAARCDSGWGDEAAGKTSPKLDVGSGLGLGAPFGGLGIDFGVIGESIGSSVSQPKQTTARPHSSHPSFDVQRMERTIDNGPLPNCAAETAAAESDELAPLLDRARPQSCDGAQLSRRRSFLLFAFGKGGQSPKSRASPAFSTMHSDRAVSSAVSISGSVADSPIKPTAEGQAEQRPRSRASALVSAVSSSFRRREPGSLTSPSLESLTSAPATPSISQPLSVIRIDTNQTAAASPVDSVPADKKGRKLLRKEEKERKKQTQQQQQQHQKRLQLQAAAASTAAAPSSPGLFTRARFRQVFKRLDLSNTSKALQQAELDHKNGGSVLVRRQSTQGQRAAPGSANGYLTAGRRQMYSLRGKASLAEFSVTGLELCTIEECGDEDERQEPAAAQTLRRPRTVDDLGQLADRPRTPAGPTLRRRLNSRPSSASLSSLAAASASGAAATAAPPLPPLADTSFDSDLDDDIIISNSNDNDRDEGAPIFSPTAGPFSPTDLSPFNRPAPAPAVAGQKSLKRRHSSVEKENLAPAGAAVPAARAELSAPAPEAAVAAKSLSPAPTIVSAAAAGPVRRHKSVRTSARHSIGDEIRRVMEAEAAAMAADATEAGAAGKEEVADAGSESEEEDERTEFGTGQAVVVARVGQRRMVCLR